MIATKINTNGSNPNLLDYFMTFNDAFLWSVSSDTDVTIKDRYINCTRTHKSI